jgi:hypothetical protein
LLLKLLLLKLFQEKKRRNATKLSVRSQYYLDPKTRQGNNKKRENCRLITMMNTEAKIPDKTLQIELNNILKYHTPRSSFFLKHTRMVRHLQISNCSTAHK